MTLNLKKRLITAEEYHKMGEANILTREDRVELIFGEIIERSPISTNHNATVDRINNLFSQLFLKDAIIRIQGSIRINDISEPEPDVILLKRVPNFYADAHPKPEDILLLIEVSGSSINYDRQYKKQLYAQAGIQEYWIVNIFEQEIEVYRNPSKLIYKSKQILDLEDSIAPLLFPEVSVKIEDILG